MSGPKAFTPRIIDLTAIGDERGWLVAMESGKSVPFSIQRVYYIYGTQPHIRRGMHAHLDLEQVAVCVAGRCTFTLDDGFDRKSVVLDSPTKGLYIGSMIWREMTEFSHDCVLMVLASRPYDEADYIRNYDEFRRQATSGE